MTTTQLMRTQLRSTLLTNCGVETPSQWITRASCVVAVATRGANRVMQAIVGFLLSFGLNHSF